MKNPRHKHIMIEMITIRIPNKIRDAITAGDKFFLYSIPNKTINKLAIKANRKSEK
jgi:hypothetical protein